MDKTSILLSYIEHESIDHCDTGVVYELKNALADIMACTIAGSQTPVVEIVKSFAWDEWGPGNSSIVMSPYKLKPTGAALVNATMANSLDIDDGYRLTKGHPGAVVFPAVLAAAEEYRISGKQFLNALLVGYEVGIRAGILAHELRPEYHCSGSWGALGAAAGVARIIGAPSNVIGHALGIAEYHSTYSPMMRCIDFPSMLKDGIGWGSMTGISSALLAKKGFTGIPSLFSFLQAERFIEELGDKYRIRELYFKPFACCRWAQPAIEGIKQISQRQTLSSDMIHKIIIHTFTESSQLSRAYPRNTEEAQYNLIFPVAAFLVLGNVGPNEVLYVLENRSVLEMMDRIETKVDPALNDRFPQKALSRVEIFLKDGRCLQSGNMQAKGDYDYPMTIEEKKNKYDGLTQSLVGKEKSERLYHVIDHLEELDDIRELTETFRTEQSKKNEKPVTQKIEEKACKQVLRRLENEEGGYSWSRSV